MLNPEKIFILDINRSYKTSAIKREKVMVTSFNFMRIFSDVPRKSILGFLFYLTHINNLSNDIVHLVKQKYAHGHISAESTFF